MRYLFITFPTTLTKDEFKSSHGLLSGYIYELFKERILNINSNFRKWRKETNNENNTQINVRNIFIIINFFYSLGQFLEI